MRFALALIITLLAALPALASPSCMTHSEAKHAYGRDTYLHWRGNHCWGVLHAAAKRLSRREVMPNTMETEHTDRRADESRRQHNAQPPSYEVGADTVWPDPPADFTWADRWPNQDRMSPDRWLLELVQFGSSGNR